MAYYAQAADKPVSTQEIGEGSIDFSGSELQLNDNNDFLNEEPEDVTNVSMLFTCQVADAFGPVKCSTTVLDVANEEFTPILHILEPVVQQFLSQTRVGDFLGILFWCKLTRSTEDAWAIVPYSQPELLSQVPCSINSEESSEEDSEEWARKFGVYNSDSNNFLDETTSYGILQDEKSRRRAMSLDVLEHMGSSNAEATFVASDAAAKKENVQRKLTTEELAGLKICDRNLTITIPGIGLLL